MVSVSSQDPQCRRGRQKNECQREAGRAVSRFRWPLLAWKVESRARSQGTCRKWVRVQSTYIHTQPLCQTWLCLFSVTFEGGSFSTCFNLRGLHLLLPSYLLVFSVPLIWGQGDFFRSSSLLILPLAVQSNVNLGSNSRFCCPCDVFFPYTLSFHSLLVVIFYLPPLPLFDYFKHILNCYNLLGQCYLKLCPSHVYVSSYFSNALSFCCELICRGDYFPVQSSCG